MGYIKIRRSNTPFTRAITLRANPLSTVEWREVVDTCSSRRATYSWRGRFGTSWEFTEYKMLVNVRVIRHLLLSIMARDLPFPVRDRDLFQDKQEEN